jgi:endoglucanase
MILDITSLKELLGRTSVSGYEGNVADFFLTHLRDYSFSQEVDALNNAYSYCGNKHATKTVMLEAHMDEIGFQVLYIDKSGYVYFRKNGGIDPCCVPGRFVNIYSLDGDMVPGVIGKKPIHLISADDRKTVPALDAMWIDTGLSAEVVSEKIHIGDPVAYVPHVQTLGESRIASKGLDDKIGLFAVMEAFRRLSKMDLGIRIAVVASSQEEVGCRGSIIGSANVMPDYSISVDVDFATDVPDCSPKSNGDIALGNGVIITRHLDSNRQFSDMAVKVAESQGIPFQISARRNATGGTDAAEIQLTNKGVKTLLLGIPNRYMHTPVELCDLKDVESAIDLMVNLVVKLSE